jgi:hypothetical protein
MVACAISRFDPPGTPHDNAYNERRIPDSANPYGPGIVIGKTTIHRLNNA